MKNVMNIFKKKTDKESKKEFKVTLGIMFGDKVGAHRVLTIMAKDETEVLNKLEKIKLESEDILSIRDMTK